MNAIASLLVAASAAILLLLGLLHLVFTFHGPRLLPRDPALKTRMQEVSPVITRQTTMWKAWIGFNASHSVALVLFRSVFLLALGLLVLLGYVFLARAYFFRAPLRSVIVATGLYVAALVVRWL